jgi:diguanylate cyclase (GGDEF)-like protein
MQQWRADASTDALTGLNNRRSLDEALRIEAKRATLRRAPFSVIMIDIDHFKHINDLHGHLAGDAVLVEVAKRLQTSTRASDLVVRYGGEEFLCVLPLTGHDDALRIAEHIRLGLSQTPIATGSAGELRLTASLGVATLEAGCPSAAERTVRAADSAMYRAKERGRNTVVGVDGPRVTARLTTPSAVGSCRAQ